MSIVNALAGVAVKDLRASLGWYEQLLGRPASRPMQDVAEFGFENGGWLQVFQDPERAGASSVTLTVSDLDEQVDVLKRNGLVVPEITRASSVNTAIINDPDGNQIVFAQPLNDSVAQ